MWKPDSTPETDWDLKLSKPILARMSEPEFFFRTLLYAKKIGLEGHENICNTYADMYVVPTDFQHFVTLSEDDTVLSDVGRDSYTTVEFTTSIERLTKKGERKNSCKTISIIEREGIYENLEACASSDQISVVNIHAVWFERIKNATDKYRRQSHGNMLLFQHSAKKIYLFDPYGMTYSTVWHTMYHGHQALRKYAAEYFNKYEYVGDIHSASRLEYPAFIKGDDGPQAIQEVCHGTAACHRNVTCQGWSSYFLLKLVAEKNIDPLFAYAHMLTDIRGSMEKKRKSSGISVAMTSILDIAKHIIDESEELILSEGKDVATCKKGCILEIMKTYLKNRIHDRAVVAVTESLS